MDEALESLAKGLSHKMLHGAMAQLNATDPELRERAKESVEHFFLKHNQTH
jgi:glutamyl-tRNA reductase